ncbi:MAG: polyphosphate kinase 1 [Rhodocyclaceae bacterium]|nr:polyphosphate kinase 1 [Planctomycetota bacterium]MCX8016288.1 polyphosphate kinase 1 [Rhodocyclaceae bacterium]
MQHRPTSVFRRERPQHDEARYLRRELSWLAFNRRVLEEAEDDRVPLLERAKFLAIVSSNLDEFVMVRVAELVEQVRGHGPEAEQARAVLLEVRSGIARLVADQYRCWRESVQPKLAQAGFRIVPPAEWNEADRESMRVFWRDQLEPIVTPLAVDPTRPFPVIPNRAIAVAVQLESGSGETNTAIVTVPKERRLIGLVSQAGACALLEDVIMHHLDALFPGHHIRARCLFRITRDGSIEIDEEQAADLLTELEQELFDRERGAPVRLEVVAGGDRGLRSWLAHRLSLDEQAIVTVDGPLDLTVLHTVGDIIDRLPGGPRADLRDPPMPVQLNPARWDDPFAVIRQRDLLLHHPYESFQRIVELVERAAEDPAVLAIKQTLYRVSGDSPIVKALARAARSGKQVTVLIELKARFDEAANIRWARALEDAGAHVIYGLVGYKVHAKLLMIVRRDDDGLRRYCHIGTGNYNDRTAKLYTDLSYLTANEAIGRDVAALFNMLTGYSRPPEFERLWVSPLTMRSNMTAAIRREAEHARAGRPSRIIAKFNALVDEAICDELYAASQAGVQIDLIVRGMCILRPGIKGLSENIRVFSIVGRLLEHSRIFYFANAGNPQWLIASADWMTRNLDRRIEVGVIIDDPALTDRLQRILEICLSDNRAVRELQADGTYVRRRPQLRERERSAFAELCAEAAAQAIVRPVAPRDRRFRPRRKGDVAR